MPQSCIGLKNQIFLKSILLLCTLWVETERGHCLRNLVRWLSAFQLVLGIELQYSSCCRESVHLYWRETGSCKMYNRLIRVCLKTSSSPRSGLSSPPCFMNLLNNAGKSEARSACKVLTSIEREKSQLYTQIKKNKDMGKLLMLRQWKIL